MFTSNTITKDNQLRVLHIKIPPNKSGVESVDVRFPTDEEWAQRTSKLKIVQRSLGRDKTTIDRNRSGVEANAQLYRRIVLNGHGHSKLDDFTASWVIDQLERCELISVRREGGLYLVVLDVKGGPVTHHINIKQLTMDRVADYRGHRTDIIRRGNNNEIRAFLEPAAELYDAIIDRTEGYGGAVPIIHKSVVVEAVLDEQDRWLADQNDDSGDDDDDDENAPDDNPDEDNGNGYGGTARSGE